MNKLTMEINRIGTYFFNNDNTYKTGNVVFKSLMKNKENVLYFCDTLEYYENQAIPKGFYNNIEFHDNTFIIHHYKNQYKIKLYDKNDKNGYITIGQKIKTKIGIGPEVIDNKVAFNKMISFVKEYGIDNFVIKVIK